MQCQVPLSTRITEVGHTGFWLCTVEPLQIVNVAHCHELSSYDSRSSEIAASVKRHQNADDYQLTNAGTMRAALHRTNHLALSKHARDNACESHYGGRNMSADTYIHAQPCASCPQCYLQLKVGSFPLPIQYACHIFDTQGRHTVWHKVITCYNRFRSLC